MLKKCYIKYIIFVLLQILNINFIHGYKINKLEPKNVNDKIGFYDEDGTQHFLEEFDDEVILLVFWARWSASCSKEITDLNLLQKDFKKLPFTVIAISEDYKGISPIQDFFKTHEINNLKIYHDPKNLLMQSFDATAIPTAFLINLEGKIVVSFTGFINWNDEDVRNIILSYIPGSEPGSRKNHKKE